MTPILTSSLTAVVTTHHVHLRAELIEQLFCDRYRLHPSDPETSDNKYSTLETVTLIGPAGRVRKVPVMGPPSVMNQIEISRSDALVLGIRAPVRESGDLIGSPGLIVEGPRSQLVIGTGVICPLRHVHINPSDAARLGLMDRDRVEVTTQATNRRLSFQDVVVRVAADSALEFHLDVDEANAAGVRTGDTALLTNRMTVR